MPSSSPNLIFHSSHHSMEEDKQVGMVVVEVVVVVELEGVLEEDEL